ncbi:MAG: hypothetical protein ACPLZY_05040 [Candidatus Norongarragalinales archaeon]
MKAEETRRSRKNNNALTVEARLRQELERLKRLLGVGNEVEVKWLPHTLKLKDGKQLLEEVVGNTIIIYAEKQDEAVKLLHHGFAEWLLNQHTKRYRLLINKLIELFEQIQYEEKEKIADAITNLLLKKNKNNTQTI